MVYKRYEKYKDSGIEWIGQIPEHWKVNKLKNLCTIATGNKDTINKEDNGIYPFYVRSPIIEKISTYSFDGEAVLTAGDGVGVGKVFHYVNGKFDFHQRVYKMSNFKYIEGKFLYYYIRENFIRETEVNNAKSTVDSIRLPMIQQFPVALPTYEEQRYIIDFLDNKITEVDGLIEYKEKQIELLKEQRQAIITEVVTKGLDKNVSMKDSGVEWIDEIPEHWSVNFFKRVILGIKDGTHGTHKRVDEGEDLLSAKNVFNDGIKIGTTESKISCDEYKKIVSNGYPKKKDILISTVGTIGRCFVYEMDKSMAFQRSVTFIRVDKSSSPYFYKYFIESTVYQEQLLSFAKTSAQSGIYMGDILKTQIVLIPLNEQMKIVHFLDKKTNEIDILINEVIVGINNLKEYKQSLISEVVTGKIDVTEK